MKTLFVFILTSFLFFNLQAQQFNYWKGGTPSKETDWNTAQNWSKNQVPDWTDDVLIPNVSTSGNFYPIIDTQIEVVQSITIYGNAELTIAAKGKLTIDGRYTYNYGITNAGMLINEGILQIDHTALSPLYHIQDTNATTLGNGITLLEMEHHSLVQN